MSLTGFNISNELLEWIKSNLSGTLLELGSGEGTKHLCKHFAKVISIEDNPQYQNLHHENYICSDIVNGWYNIETIRKGLKGQRYNAILVDGPLGAIGRNGFYSNLELFNTSVPIIIDDTHRKDELLLFKKLQEKLRGRKEIHIIGANKKASILW